MKNLITALLLISLTGCIFNNESIEEPPEQINPVIETDSWYYPAVNDTLIISFPDRAVGYTFSVEYYDFKGGGYGKSILAKNSERDIYGFNSCVDFRPMALIVDTECIQYQITDFADVIAFEIVYYGKIEYK